MARYDEFTTAYIEAALWSSLTDEGEPLDLALGVTDIAPETLAKMVADCASFQAKAGEMISDALSRAGHDFWLTRNGHGAGFWDGDWPENGDALTALADTYGGFDLYVGDDGQIWA